MSVRCFVAWGACLAAFLGIFQDVLFWPRNFAYRDTATFYYPLYRYVQSELQAGRLPLWNPYQNGGEPLAASATAAAWYPLKLLFLLPLDYDWAYKLYILVHVVIAAAAMGWLVHACRRSTEAAALAGLCYALGASVMFQHANVVFLCGAAWLPLAAMTGLRLIESRNWRWGAGLGAVLALMVTAGDPQMAYQAGLLVGLFALIHWRSERIERRSAAGMAVDASRTAGRKQPSKKSRAARRQTSPTPWRARRWVLLAIAGLWAAALSSVQLLPAVELSRRTDRGYFDVPRSLYEVPRFLLRSGQAPPHPDGTPATWYDGLRGRPPRPLSHALHQYDFSVAPWRLVELVWPNFSGRPFPEYRRWLVALGGEPAFWTPSLYLGILPLLLACSAFTLRGVDARLQWFSWLVLIGLVGSWGNYGLGWLLRQLFGGNAAEMPISDAVGGVYWLFNVVLPGFVEFRFPGKLMVIASFALAALAAHGWDRLAADSTRSISRWLAVLGLISLVLALAAWGLKGVFVSALGNAPPDPMFGPLNAHGAWLDLVRSLLHTAVFCGIWWWLLGPLRAKAGWPMLSWAAVPLCALDLVLANSWMTLTAPASAWQGSPQLAALLDDETDSPAPVRFYQPPSLAAQAWSDSSDLERAADVVAWQRQTMAPNFHLSGRRASARLAGTTILFDYEQFMSPAALPENSRIEFIRPRRGLDAWGTAYFVLPVDDRPDDSTSSSRGLRRQWLQPSWLPERPQGEPEGEPLPRISQAGEQQGLANELEVLVNTARFPRAWMVHEVLPILPLASHDVRSVQPLMQAILFPDRQWIDLRKTAVVEHAALSEAAAGGMWRLAEAAPQAGSCRIAHYEPDHVELDVDAPVRGLVVLAETYYPGWTLEIVTNGQAQPAEVLKTNRLMRGALVPAGQHRLIYRYRPASFRWGASISLAALLLLAVVTARSVRR